MRIALWTVQVLLAALFLMGGIVKLVMPLDEMVAQSGLPGPFILFLGVVETLGALGLILPGLTKIRPGLTPLAAVAYGADGLCIEAHVEPSRGLGDDPKQAITPAVLAGLITKARALHALRRSAS